MKKKGPRDWSPRPEIPTLGDLDEAQDVWDEMKEELTGIISRIEDIGHYIYKARHWMRGGRKISQQDALELAAAIRSVGKRLQDFHRDEADTIEVSGKIAEWLVKMEKES